MEGARLSFIICPYSSWLFISTIQKLFSSNWTVRRDTKPKVSVIFSAVHITPFTESTVQILDPVILEHWQCKTDTSANIIFNYIKESDVMFRSWRKASTMTTKCFLVTSSRLKWQITITIFGICLVTGSSPRSSATIPSIRKVFDHRFVSEMTTHCNPPSSSVIVKVGHRFEFEMTSRSLWLSKAMHMPDMNTVHCIDQKLLTRWRFEK